MTLDHNNYIWKYNINCENGLPLFYQLWPTYMLILVFKIIFIDINYYYFSFGHDHYFLIYFSFEPNPINTLSFRTRKFYQNLVIIKKKIATWITMGPLKDFKDLISITSGNWCMYWIMETKYDLWRWHLSLAYSFIVTLQIMLRITKLSIYNLIPLYS